MTSRASRLATVFAPTTQNSAVTGKWNIDISFSVGDLADSRFYSFYCRRGQELLCEDFKAHGVIGLDGGFAEYVRAFNPIHCIRPWTVLLIDSEI